MCKKTSTHMVLELVAIFLVAVLLGAFVLKLLIMCADSINDNATIQYTQSIR